MADNGWQITDGRSGSMPIFHLPSAICHLPSAICHLPSAICHLPSAICHLPSAICHLPFGPRNRVNTFPKIFLSSLVSRCLLLSPRRHRLSSISAFENP